jgi:hypothetical protein
MYFITDLVIMNMYDTVNFRLPITDVGTVDFLQETPCYLDSDTIGFHDWSGKQIVTGNVGNLNVSISKRQVKVKDGSLCKWYLGDNFKTMGRGDVQRAIELLSDTLHLPMDKATVTRLDIGQNFIVKYPAPVYFNHLGLLKHAKRLVEPNGLYYCQRDRRLCFYDKCREQKAKNEVIPELYKGRNVLRYEQRYAQRVAAQFGVANVTGALLYDEAFYIDVIQRWLDAYKAVNKINEITLNFQAMTSKQQFYKMGVLTMVERVGGEIEMISQITEAQKRGELTAKQAYDLRQAVKTACSAKDGLTTPNEAIDELNRKIIEAVRFYR